MIRIGIAEDIPKLANSLTDKIELSNQFKVIFIAKNGKEAITEVVKNPDLDILLMDINMPVLDGIEATKKISALFRSLKIIMVTIYDDEEHIFNAILAGAQGYFLKDEPPQDIHKYLEESMAGGAPMSPEVAASSLRLIQQNGLKTKRKTDFGLTARELDILKHLKKGLTYESIANELIISKGTVRKHVENIYRKLQVNNRVSALNKLSEN